MTVNVSPSATAPRYSYKITANTPFPSWTTTATIFSINAPVGTYLVAQSQLAYLAIGSFGVTISGNGYGTLAAGVNGILGAPQYFYNTTGATTGTIDVSLNTGWTRRVTDFGVSFGQASIIFGSGIYVAAYAGAARATTMSTATSAGAAVKPSTLATSTDGITWTTRNSNFGTSNNAITSIGYLSTVTNKYLIAGYIGDVLPALCTSTDGTTWTTRNPGFGTSIARINAAVGGNGIYIIAGFGTSISSAMGINTSTDGITWTVRTSTAAASGFGTSGSIPQNLLYAAGKTNQYVLSGVNGPTVVVSAVSTSTDGITWTTRAVPNFANGSNVITSSAFGASTYVLGGNFGVSTRLVASTDGVTWTTQTTTFLQGDYCSGLVYGNGVFIIVDSIQNAPIGISTNGTTWQYISLFNTSAGNDQRIAFGVSLGQALATVSLNGIASSASNPWGNLLTDFAFTVEGPSPVTTIL